MRFIDNIIINEMEFRTRTYDRCIYTTINDCEPVYLLCQMDDLFFLGARNKRW